MTFLSSLEIYSLISYSNSNSFKMVTQTKISLDKEKTTQLSKKVFEEFKKQGINVSKIISSDFTLTVK